MSSRIITLLQADSDRQYPVEVLDTGHQARIDERVYTVTHEDHGTMRITSDHGHRATTAWTVVVGDVRWVFVDGRVFELAEALPVARARSGHPGSLMAPMPATVRRVLVSAGDTVQRGDSLVILEAMKMELPVRANAPGLVRAVHCREGEIVQPGLALIEIDEGQ